MTEEQELEAMEESYQDYAKIRQAYKALILLEDDPQRKRILKAMLEDMNEENK